MRDTSLHISLGHSSSAAFAVDGVVVRAYEQERLDRKKNSSAYPAMAIEAAVGGPEAVAGRAYVSHWFDHFDASVGDAASRYLDVDHLCRHAGHVVWPNPMYTHHDAHAHSATAFARGQGVSGPAVVVVADGFGNLQECLSVYDLDGGMRLRHRTHGMASSLGLMYQYVTEFLGLRPNQDEYKLLGYEAHVLEHAPLDVVMPVRERVAAQGHEHALAMLESTARPEPTDRLVDYDALGATKDLWFAQTRAWRGMFPWISSRDALRACVAFCAQTFLEEAMTRLLRELVPVGTRQVVLAGGVFYNVKLNRRVQLSTGCRVFSHPLAGDQGAALGMGDRPALLSLCVGERSFVVGRRPPAFSRDTAGVHLVESERWADRVGELLLSGHVVNLVRGGMEFGPRALCNTSTLALPTPANVARINSLNDRDDFMPMAPVMTERAARRLLDPDELAAAKGSEGFMITTVAWNGAPAPDMKGVAHRDPLAPTWTCRPQVVREHDDPGLTALLMGMPGETLINTSFNYHGEPIVMSFVDAVRTHELQTRRAAGQGGPRPVTVVAVDP